MPSEQDVGYALNQAFNVAGFIVAGEVDVIEGDAEWPEGSMLAEQVNGIAVELIPLILKAKKKALKKAGVSTFSSKSSRSGKSSGSSKSRGSSRGGKKGKNPFVDTDTECPDCSDEGRDGYLKENTSNSGPLFVCSLRERKKFGSKYRDIGDCDYAEWADDDD